jgi:hypothetical protein
MYLGRSLTDVSEESTVGGAYFLLVSYLAHSSTLKVEAVGSYETWVDLYLTTWRYIAEDRTCQCHHCENLKSNMPYMLRESRQLSRYS